VDSRENHIIQGILKDIHEDLRRREWTESIYSKFIYSRYQIWTKKGG